MLPLPAKLHLYLGGDILAAAQVATGKLPQITFWRQEACEGDGIAEALSRCLPIQSGVSYSASLTLDFPYVYYVVLPWSQALSDSVVRERAANAMLRRQYPEELTPMRVVFGPMRYRQPLLAALVPEELLRRIEDAALRQRVVIREITPILAQVWNRYRQQLPPTGTLAVASHGRLLVMQYASGQVGDVSICPYSSDMRNLPLRSDHAIRVLHDDGLFPDFAEDARLPLPDIEGIPAEARYTGALALCGVR